jgi:ABC-type methionine transport system permease subunit
VTTTSKSAIEEHEADMKIDLLIIAAAFVLASALAGALGAANLGTALAFGQMAFAVSVVYVLLKR